MLLTVYKKHSDKTIFPFIVLFAIVFHWSCKKETGPVAPPSNNTAEVTYAGKTYHVVQIGSQYWLNENLDVGTMIPGTDTAKNNGTIEKYCYLNDTANCHTHGGLYQWNEAMQYSKTPGAQGICPSGWHIPKLAEFQTLDSTVHGDGNALKAIGQGDGSGAGTDSSGFSALFAGYRNDQGYFDGVGDNTSFWSSTEYDATSAYFLSLYFGYSGLYPFSFSKGLGYSVRCLKD